MDFTFSVVIQSFIFYFFTFSIIVNYSFFAYYFSLTFFFGKPYFLNFSSEVDSVVWTDVVFRKKTPPSLSIEKLLSTKTWTFKQARLFYLKEVKSICSEKLLKRNIMLYVYPTVKYNCLKRFFKTILICFSPLRPNIL
jgi:hypothetical protein